MNLENITIDEGYEMEELTLRNGDVGNASSSIAFIYVVRGATNELEACTAAYAKTPNFIYDVDGIRKIPKLQSRVHEKCGDSIWKVAVEYAFTTGSSPTSNDDEQDGDDVPEVSFQCSPTTIHVVQAIDQECVYKRNGVPAISHDAAKQIPIGWNGQRGAASEAAGVDIPSGELREVYTKTISFEKARSWEWRRKMAHCQGKVNLGEFKGWERGEVLFLGCGYSTPLRGVDKVKVSFEFLIRMNETKPIVAGKSFDDGGGLYGHQYAWVVTSDAVSGESVTKVVDYIFRSDVIEAIDFDQLGV